VNDDEGEVNFGVRLPDGRQAAFDPVQSLLLDIRRLDAIQCLRGQPAPQFAYKASHGEPVVLSDYKGKVVLLNFWASW